MDDGAWIYQADIYCGDCAQEICKRLDARGGADEDDSESYPQGPYPDGGGEADSPQYCGGCSGFLGNLLTDDGMESVYTILQEAVVHGKEGDTDRLSRCIELVDCYGVSLCDLLDFVFRSKP